jgi:hypothetical protein
MLPTADEISQAESKERPLPIEPWVAANLSRLWQTMKKQIQETIASGKQVQHHTVQSEPASVRSHS